VALLLASCGSQPNSNRQGNSGSSRDEAYNSDDDGEYEDDDEYDDDEDYDDDAEYGDDEEYEDDGESYDDGESSDDDNQASGISRRECDNYKNDLINQWKDDLYSKCKRMDDNMCITRDGVSLRLKAKLFGGNNTSNRSLWISMHGGGGTDAATNDQQWQNQIDLYEPAEGLYVAPRAPWDAWDMWFQAPIDGLFEDLITMGQVLYDVDPNKVYLMGYSAGGDGVWRLGPRLADHWAAASMMAGHPGDVSLVNLRNCPFMIWCGANDDAYNRVNECRRYGQIIEQLWHGDEDGYKFYVSIVDGKGHWMDRVDSYATTWMPQFVRDPYPSRVVWQQEEVLEDDFYWLAAPKNELRRGNTIIAEIAGNNVINIERCDYSSIQVMLNDEMVNLDKPVVIRYNGKTVFSGMAARSKENMRKTLYARNDKAYIFPAIVTVRL